MSSRTERRNRTLAGAMAALLILGSLAAAQVPVAGTDAGPAVPADADLDRLAGKGTWQRILCIGCIAAFIGAAGTSVVGLGLLIATHPEAAVACAAVCYEAYA